MASESENMKKAEVAIAKLMAKRQEDEEESSEEEEVPSHSRSCFPNFFSRSSPQRKKDSNEKAGTATPAVAVTPPPPPKRFFGVLLTDVYQKEELLTTIEKDWACPIPVVMSVQYLKKVIHLEGLFRVSGTWGEVNRLRSTFESGQTPDMTKVDNPHSITSLLDAYLRQLPNPLLTNELYDEFIRCGAVTDIEQKIKVVKATIKQLPLPHFSVLRYLLPFFKEIADNSAKNKMDSKNLGLIFGPILMGGDEALSLLQIGKIKTQANLVELMISQCERLLNEEEPKEISNESSKEVPKAPQANGEAENGQNVKHSEEEEEEESSHSESETS